MQEAEVLVEQGDLLQQVSVASMAGGMILMGIPISILYIVLFRIYAESKFNLTVGMRAIYLCLGVLYIVAAVGVFLCVTLGTVLYRRFWVPLVYIALNRGFLVRFFWNIYIFLFGSSVYTVEIRVLFVFESRLDYTLRRTSFLCCSFLVYMHLNFFCFAYLHAPDLLLCNLYKRKFFLLYINIQLSHLR